MSFKRLLNCASEVVDGVQANQWLWRQSKQIEAKHGRFIFYEILLEKTLWSDFVTTGLDNLLDHIEAKKEQPPAGVYFLILIWHQNLMHVFTAPSFFEVLSEIEGQNTDQLIYRAKKLGDPLALPPPAQSKS